MKLSIKSILPLAILLLGTSNCSETRNESGKVNESEALKKEIDEIMNFKENMCTALSNPVFLYNLKSFSDWNSKLNPEKPNEKKEMLAKIKKNHAHEYYRLPLDSDQIKQFNEVLDLEDVIRDENSTDKVKNVSFLKRINGTKSEFAKSLENIESNVKSSDEEVKSNLLEVIKNDFEAKKNFMNLIMSQIPVIKNILTADDQKEELKMKIKSHIFQYISKALEFDQVRSNYSNLHHSLETIKSIIEVNRKAKHSVDAFINALDDKTFELEKSNINNLGEIYFTVKRKPVIKNENKKDEDKNENKKDNKDENEKKNTGKKTINIIAHALEAATKSTSCPNVLFSTLLISLLLSSALIGHNAITAKAPEDEEEEDDEECGKH